MIPFGHGERFPYTNFHDMNQDWLIQTVLEMRNQVENGVANINAEVEQAINNMMQSGEFADIIASIANENIFYCVSPNMTQELIQEAINTHTAIKFMPGTYSVYIPEINDYGYSIPSNRIIFFDNCTIKKVGKFDHDYDSIIIVDNVTNVTMFGNCVLDYNRNYMLEQTGEHGMCLSIGSSSHISVEGLQCINAFGDGIYLNNNQYVYINNVYCYNNRRNGMAIISGQHYRIENSYFLNSNGTTPEAGLAIENNYNTDIMKDIVITDCFSYGNNGNNDVYITIKSDNGSVRINNIKCDSPIPVVLWGDKSRVKISNSLFGVKTASNLFNVDSVADNEIIYENCEIDGNGTTSSGSFIRYTSSSFHNLIIDNCLIHDVTLTGRAVLALGTLTDVNRILVNCKSYNFNMATPMTMLRTAVENAYLKWSIENMDPKEFAADSPYPFNNYIISENTRPGNVGAAGQTLRVYNDQEEAVSMTANTFYIPTGTASTIAIQPGSWIELSAYKSGWWVDHLEVAGE